MEKKLYLSHIQLSHVFGPIGHGVLQGEPKSDWRNTSFATYAYRNSAVSVSLSVAKCGGLRSQGTDLRTFWHRAIQSHPLWPRGFYRMGQKFDKNSKFWPFLAFTSFISQWPLKIEAYKITRDMRSFQILFELESDVQIRFDSKVTGRFENFESPRLSRLPSYHKQHSLFNDKFQSFRHCYWDLYWV